MTQTGKQEGLKVGLSGVVLTLLTSDPDSKSQANKRLELWICYHELFKVYFIGKPCNVYVV